MQSTKITCINRFFTFDTCYFVFCYINITYYIHMSSAFLLLEIRVFYKKTIKKGSLNCFSKNGGEVD
ncbi:hypothetical protein FM106_07080 [Brachybacterium faecium]|nr:hypothetical protein FM106_07080 [Brachybacterium faecium]